MTKPLYIFDFDDTLALTDSKIIVIKVDGSELELDSKTFAEYRAEPGDQFDFSQFGEGSPVTGTLIDSTIREMQQAMASFGDESVYIVTARSANKPVTAFLQNLGIQPPQVVATTGSENKARWLQEKLESGPYTEVYVYEDCSKNISMLEDVVNEFNAEFGNIRPKVTYNAQCIVAESLRPIIRNLVLEFSIMATRKNMMLDRPSNHGGWPEGPSRSAVSAEPVVDEIYSWFREMGLID